MPVLGKPTLRRYFEDGKGLTNQAFVALSDSFLSLNDTTAQTMNSDLIVNGINPGTVSAGDGNFQSLDASALSFSGLLQHGVSAANSAVSTLGYVTVVQQATVPATATTQIALMPDSVNITGLGLNVLAASSGAVGGTEVQIGNGAAIDYFGTISVSAVGNYKLTNVCARRLQGVSGAIYAAGITATVGSNFVPYVEYYQTLPAPATPQTLVAVVNVSTISNMGNSVFLFDGNTDHSTSNIASIASAKAFAGQAWNAAKRIGQFAIWDPNNEGWNSLGNPVTIRLYGNITNNPGTAVILSSADAPYVAPTVVVTAAQADIDTTNAFPYHWVGISAGPAGTTYIAEVKFWELL